jgi:sodium/bile acid cotransporter 7
LLKVLLPIILGLILNPLLKNWVTKYAKIIAEFDKMIILLIVYESFSEAFSQNVFASVPSSVFLIIAVSVFLYFSRFTEF